MGVRPRLWVVLACLAVVFLFAMSPASLIPLGAKAASPSYANWVNTAYDTYNTDFDPQTVINSTNAQNLQIQWVYQVPSNPFVIPGAPTAEGIETNPLVVDGYVYIATPYNRLIALNGASGAAVWQYQVNMSQFIADPWWAEAYTISSITYYNGSILMMASDTSVYAINALTGKLEWEIPNTGAAIPGNTGTYFGEKAPFVYKDELIVRASASDHGGRGYVAAYGLTTHDLLWRWYSVPPVGGNATWDTDECAAPCHGNVAPYTDDWGNNTLMGGADAWGLMTVDNSTGVLYFSTGHPAGLYNADMRPGPDLYSDSVIALNATNGKMLWYYQFTSHDLAEHEGGWSITLANLTIGGQQRTVLIQAAKNNYVYVLDATTGQLVYPAIAVGAPPSNNPNDNEVANANLVESQSAMVGGRICPGPDGGVEMSPAIDGDNLFLVSQNACGIMYAGPVTYKGQTVQGFVYEGDPTATQNSTLYSLNLATGKVNWEFNMPDRYQGSSAVVSGGVVYIVDRQGTLYMLNEKTGALIRSLELNGLGAAGVAIGEDSEGTMMVFVPAGGGGSAAAAGVVVGLALVGSTTVSTSSASQLQLVEEAAILVGVVVIVVGMLVLVRRASRTAPRPPLTDG